jgi:NAD(P)H-dependent FMN reductase
MNILGISGSLRAGSANTALLRAAASLAAEGVAVTVYHGVGDLPHFSPDLDTDPPPAPVAHLRSLLAAADAVLICTPEYAFGIPGALKNALDWCVSSGEFDRKPTAALSASPGYGGGAKGLASLLTTVGALGAAVPDGATLGIPAVRSRLDVEGARITDPETADAVRAVLDALINRAEAGR